MNLIKVSKHFFSNIEAVLQIAQELVSVGSVVELSEGFPPVLTSQEAEDYVIALHVRL